MNLAPALLVALTSLFVLEATAHSEEQSTELNSNYKPRQLTVAADVRAGLIFGAVGVEAEYAPEPWIAIAARLESGESGLILDSNGPSPALMVRVRPWRWQRLSLGSGLGLRYTPSDTRDELFSPVDEIYEDILTVDSELFAEWRFDSGLMLRTSALVGLPVLYGACEKIGDGDSRACDGLPDARLGVGVSIGYSF